MSVLLFCCSVSSFSFLSRALFCFLKNKIYIYTYISLARSLFVNVLVFPFPLRSLPPPILFSSFSLLFPFSTGSEGCSARAGWLQNGFDCLLIYQAPLGYNAISLKSLWVGANPPRGGSCVVTCPFQGLEDTPQN